MLGFPSCCQIDVITEVGKLDVYSKSCLCYNRKDTTGGDEDASRRIEE